MVSLNGSLNASAPSLPFILLSTPHHYQIPYHYQ